MSQPATQAYHLEIDIANDSGEDLAALGFAFRDVFGAEFDMDPAAEDADDGTADEACADGTCDGVATTAGACAAAWDPSRPPGRFRGKPASKLHPEFVDIAAPADGAACTVEVWITTDENPASAKGQKGGPNAGIQQFEPTSCEVEPGTGDPVFTVNPGVALVDQASGAAVLGFPDSAVVVGCQDEADG